MPKTARESASTTSARREQIVAIAAAVFARKGVANATVRDIADEAGILSGSLYHHFESKDQIIEEVMRPALIQRRDMVQEIASRNLDPVTALKEMLAENVRLAALEPLVTTILRHDSRQLEQEPRFAFITDYKAGIQAAFVEVLQRGVAEGKFCDLDPVIVYYAMIDAVMGSVRYTTTGPHREPAVVAETLGQLFTQAVGASA